MGLPTIKFLGNSLERFVEVVKRTVRTEGMQEVYVLLSSEENNFILLPLALSLQLSLIDLSPSEELVRRKSSSCVPSTYR